MAEESVSEESADAVAAQVSDSVLQPQPDKQATETQAITAPTERSSVSTASKSSVLTETKSRFLAFFRSLGDVDFTNIQVLPALRVSVSLMVTWKVLGLEDIDSSFFQLGCILVGIIDPQGSLGRRVHYMIIVLSSAIALGAFLPSVVWDSSVATLVTAFVLAFATGYSPIMGSAAIFMMFKLGSVMFAVNVGVNRSINGFGDIATPILYTFCGGLTSVLLALIPDMLGNREGMRSQLARVWFGFGMNLGRWNGNWATVAHQSTAPAPTITMSISKTRQIIEKDTADDPAAKEWLLKFVDSANTIRMASVCLSSGYELTEDCLNSTRREAVESLDKDDVHKLFAVIGCACRRIAFSLQFPWLMRYIPFFRNRVENAKKLVADAAANLKKSPQPGLAWVPAIVDLLQTEVETVVDRVLDAKSWPPYASITILPRRIAAAIPTKMRKPLPDPALVFRSFAFRFAVAFTLANVPGIYAPRNSSSYWLPMTVALIMNPTEASTYQRVAHRTFGTLLGIGLASALFPLGDHNQAMIVVLGLFIMIGGSLFAANYAIFTFFITGWVCIVTGRIGVELEHVIMYRVCWTLSAATLVIITTYLIPSKSEYKVTKTVIDMAKAVRAYSEVVMKHQRLKLETEVDMVNSETLAAAEGKVIKARTVVVGARVAMLATINEATMLPSSGYVVDPHEVAPAVASYLIGTAIIPHVVSLLPQECVEDLLRDIDERSLEELDRAIRRLEGYVKVPLVLNEGVADAITITEPARGPFSHAIGLLHRKLDEAQVPRDTNRKR